MKLTGTSLNCPTHTLLHSVPPTLQHATADPRFLRIFLDTHGQVRDSLLWGHCSFLPGWCAQGSVCALQESVSQPCVSSGSSLLGLMATFSKRAHAIPKSQHPEPLALQQSTADPYPTGDTQTQFWLSLWVLLCRRSYLSPLSPSGRYGV